MDHNSRTKSQKHCQGFLTRAASSSRDTCRAESGGLAVAEARIVVVVVVEVVVVVVLVARAIVVVVVIIILCNNSSSSSNTSSGNNHNHNRGPEIGLGRGVGGTVL